jgi:hypothetical protein
VLLADGGNSSIPVVNCFVDPDGICDYEAARRIGSHNLILNPGCHNTARGFKLLPVVIFYEV